MSTVDVRYVVAVYATVDTETGEVIRVFESDENITRIDDQEHALAMISGDVLEEDAVGDNDRLTAEEITNLTVEERTRILQIADEAVWPNWERG